MSRFWKIMFLIGSMGCLLQTGCFQKMQHGFSFFPTVRAFSIPGLTT